MSARNDVPLENKREFSRVEARIPMAVRFVPLEERRHVHSRVEDGIPDLSTPPDVENPQLAEWLKLLNNKIDMLLRMATTKEENAPAPAYQAGTISGGGLSFVGDKEFSQSDVLEIKIKLPARTSRVLIVYGEVVKSLKGADGYLTSVRFIMLNDLIRDEIVKFVFEREREILRERRGE